MGPNTGPKRSESRFGNETENKTAARRQNDPQMGQLGPQNGTKNRAKTRPKRLPRGRQHEIEFFERLGAEIGRNWERERAGWRQGRGSLGEELDLTSLKHALLPR